jgi:hypothetical protein
MKRQPAQSEEMPTFIGIDYHKTYSVYSVLDVQGDSLGQGRIEHAHPEDFRGLVRRWPGCRVVFEGGPQGLEFPRKSWSFQRRPDSY